MQIAELLTPRSVIPALKSTAKDDIIRELLYVTPFDRTRISEHQVLDAVMEREKVTSTGIGEGVAIPHAKCDIREDLVMSFGLAPRPVEFAALDNKPVQIFFMLLSRKDVSGLHIKMLARIARLLRSTNIRRDLLQCRTALEILELFRREEAQLQ